MKQIEKGGKGIERGGCPSNKFTQNPQPPTTIAALTPSHPRNVQPLIFVRLIQRERQCFEKPFSGGRAGTDTITAIGLSLQRKRGLACYLSPLCPLPRNIVLSLAGNRDCQVFLVTRMREARLKCSKGPFINDVSREGEGGG